MKELTKNEANLEIINKNLVAYHDFINYIDNFLYIAIKNQNIEFIKTLIKNKRDIEIKDHQKPTFLSSLNKFEEIMQILLDQDANQNIIDKEGQSLMKLISDHIIADAREKYQWTIQAPLLQELSYNFLKATEELIDSKNEQLKTSRSNINLENMTSNLRKNHDNIKKYFMNHLINTLDEKYKIINLEAEEKYTKIKQNFEKLGIIFPDTESGKFNLDLDIKEKYFKTYLEKIFEVEISFSDGSFCMKSDMKKIRHDELNIIKETMKEFQEKLHIESITSNASLAEISSISINTNQAKNSRT